MSEDLNFQDRMYLESQAVYQRIVEGQVTDVEAELMDAQLRASQGGEDA
ncbi:MULTISPECIES: hypothetical protein [Streptomyces]|jgi:hypothetical protein|nr:MULTISPECIES: hypothetical protein [Streptomyces]MCX4421454.1 hypothetical protein [Streptomyces mirabilis]PBC96177.1 hypothetical protein BX281_4167 [Streptomyces sp. Ag82_O1-15]PBC96200.1 hypothetical protein BX281_4191 [Streptomyces sp. Ag82_O1-15]